MPSTSFKPVSVAIALIGYYPKWYPGKLKNITETQKIRGDLALTFIEKATSKGYKIVFVDGGSSESFLQRVHEFSGIIFQEMREKIIKRSPKKQRAFMIASKIPNVKAIVTTEAEKISLIDAIPEIVSPLVSDEADIVIPQRKEEIFKETYPLFQYTSEKEANRRYNQALRDQHLLSKKQSDFDFFFGPVAFQNKPEIVSLFLQRISFRKYETEKLPSEFHDPDQYANAYYFPSVLALQHKKRVISVEVPFAYPAIQRENEEALEEEFTKKRMLQKEGIISNLHDFLLYLENKKE